MNKIILPQSLSRALAALGTPPCRAYITGAFLRDALLGLSPTRANIVTTSSLTPESAPELSVSIARDLVEYPSTEDYLRAVSLFSCDALAYNETEGLIDPCGGVSAIESRTLSLCSDDIDRSLTLLSALEYCAKYGLLPDAQLKKLENDSVGRLRRRGVQNAWEPLANALSGKYAAAAFGAFFATVRALIPELDPLDDGSPFGPYRRALTSLDLCATPQVRAAVLLRSLCARGTEEAENVLYRLECPDDVREQIMFLLDNRFAAVNAERDALEARFGAQKTALLLEFFNAISRGFHPAGPDRQTV